MAQIPADRAVHEAAQEDAPALDDGAAAGRLRRLRRQFRRVAGAADAVVGRRPGAAAAAATAAAATAAAAAQLRRTRTARAGRNAARGRSTFSLTHFSLETRVSRVVIEFAP